MFGFSSSHALRLRSHRNIRYTVYGIRYTLFGIQYTLYGHGGSHRSSTCCQCALFVSMKKVAKSVFCIFMRIQIQLYMPLLCKKLFLTKKSPRTSSIGQVIFSFWAFEISEDILRNQKFIIG